MPRYIQFGSNILQNPENSISPKDLDFFFCCVSWIEFWRITYYYYYFRFKMGKDAKAKPAKGGEKGGGGAKGEEILFDKIYRC